ncbi:uncharacterized protein LOC127002550 [Eriocheir sinensis]|uniref:uncharacterized protein LOC127002550 n=1 Tax=Eriocheir sinensis TaxID=95602 RepID=UPI0021CA2FBA|nr:uncharacterized protein LOC127002550 [Eriocheir sinensis]
MENSCHSGARLLTPGGGWARLALLLTLVVSSVSAGPVRERRTHRASAHQRHTSLDWQITQQRLRRSEHYSSSSSRGGSSRFSSTMGDQPDEAGSSHSSGRSSRMADVHWSQPCTGLARNPRKKPHELTKHILHELSLAHSFLGVFKDKYAKSVTDSKEENPWDSLVNNYTTWINFDFLTNTTPAGDVDDFNAQLLHAYEKMQRLAVGIEQVTLDQALYEGELLQDFHTIETHIVKILCQLHYAMVHQELQPPATVTKEIMGENYRDLDGTSERKMRDIIIVVEYNKAINNLVDTFLKFKEP